MTSSGRHISVFLPNAVAEYLDGVAAEAKMPLSAVIRDRVIETLPEAIRSNSARTRVKKWTRAREKPADIDPESSIDVQQKPKAKPSDAELMAQHRADVISARARGYSATAIAAMFKIPYRLVETILRSR
jgi:hypothetical protein